jgi:hypothetical protein
MDPCLSWAWLPLFIHCLDFFLLSGM